MMGFEALSRPMRSLMMALALGSLLGTGTPAGTHCSRHDTAMGGHHATGQVTSGHECDHCPASECATLVPCASGRSSQSAPAAGSTPFVFLTIPITTASADQRLAVTSFEPPTPPPQAAA